MLHVKQPNGYTCAPAVVAIITGAPLAELIAEMRTTPSGTRHKFLRAALVNRGVRCGDRFVSVRGRALPDTAIVRTVGPDRFGDDFGHVVVKHGRTWLDPALDKPFVGEPIMTVSGVRYWVGPARIVSALWFEV